MWQIPAAEKSTARILLQRLPPNVRARAIARQPEKRLSTRRNHLRTSSSLPRPYVKIHTGNHIGSRPDNKITIHHQIKYSLLCVHYISHSSSYASWHSSFRFMPSWLYRQHRPSIPTSSICSGMPTSCTGQSTPGVSSCFIASSVHIVSWHHGSHQPPCPSSTIRHSQS